MKRRLVSREAFAAEFFPGATRIAPGIWQDGHGDIHFSVPELLALVDLPDTPENRDAVVQMVANMVGPDVELRRNDPIDH